MVKRDLALSLVFLVVGICVLVTGIPSLRETHGSTEWPSVKGTVLQSKVIEESPSVFADGPSTLHSAKIVYRYTVEGKRYTSGMVSFRARKMDSTTAHDVVSRYPTGQHVRVFYNPDQPEIAVLEPGFDWSTYVCPGMGAFFAIAGGLGAISAIRKGTSSQARAACLLLA